MRGMKGAELPSQVEFPLREPVRGDSQRLIFHLEA